MSGRRFILGIETSNPSIGAGVALSAGGTLGSEPVEAGTRRSDDLMGAIDRVCSRLGATPRDLEKIVVSLGPGAYTSLRIAVTTARALAEATGARLIGVPTWRSIWRATACVDGPVAVCLASKGDSTACVVVDGEARTPGGAEPRVVRAPDLAGLHGALGVRQMIGDGHLPGPIRAEAERLGLEILPPVLVAEGLLSFVNEGEPGWAEGDAVRPIYAREPDAVTQWRARHGG